MVEDASERWFPAGYRKASTWASKKVYSCREYAKRNLKRIEQQGLLATPSSPRSCTQSRGEDVDDASYR